MLEVAFINESTNLDDQDVARMMPALLTQWNEHLAPIWSVQQANFELVGGHKKPASGSWWVVFLDNCDRADSESYHDLTTDGMPMSKVFVETIMDDRTSLSVAASHEILEMAVDPWLNKAFRDSTGKFWAAEISDPVEDDRYGYEIDGVLVSNFVTPSWFGYECAPHPLDYRQLIRKPFDVLDAGYALRFDPHMGWQQVNGEKARPSKVVAPAKGSRRERRGRPWGRWKSSTPKRFKHG